MTKLHGLNGGDMTQNLKIPSTAQTAKPQLAAVYLHDAFIFAEVLFKDSLAPFYFSNSTSNVTRHF